MSIDYITPETYNAKRRHRRLADGIAAELDIEIRDITCMERSGDKWYVTVLLRDADDRPFLITERVICTRTVVSPPWSWEAVTPPSP